MPDAIDHTRSGPDPVPTVIDFDSHRTKDRRTVSAIGRELPSISLIVITLPQDTAVSDQNLEAVAASYLVSGRTAAAIMEGIQSGLAGEHVVKLPAPVQGEMAERLNLTPRQKDVLRLLLENKSNKMIARELGLSHHTVRNHIALLMRSLRVQRRKQIGPRARALGLMTTGILEGEKH
ncbi:MAG: response regulator transcription factor [Sphingorhabdus sp.]